MISSWSFLQWATVLPLSNIVTTKVLHRCLLWYERWSFNVIDYCMCVLQIFVACDKDSYPGIRPVYRVVVKYTTFT